MRKSGTRSNGASKSSDPGELFVFGPDSISRQPLPEKGSAKRSRLHGSCTDNLTCEGSADDGDSIGLECDRYFGVQSRGRTRKANGPDPDERGR